MTFRLWPRWLAETCGPDLTFLSKSIRPLVAEVETLRARVAQTEQRIERARKFVLSAVGNLAEQFLPRGKLRGSRLEAIAPHDGEPGVNGPIRLS